MEIGILTDRSYRSRHIFMSPLYDFEDCIVNALGAELVHVPPRRSDLAGRCKRKLGIEGIKLNKTYDVLFCINMYPGQLHLDRVINWRQRSKKCICYIFDWFPNFDEGDLVPPYGMRHLQNVDLLCLSYKDPVAAVENFFKPPLLWVPQAIDPDIFNFVDQIDRGVAVYAFGRQPKNVIDKVQDYCVQNDLLMIYSVTDTHQPVLDPKKAQLLHAQTLLHAKTALNWSTDFVSPNKSLGFDPTTCRWYEAAAAGCISIGKQPSDNEFNELFPVPGAVQNISDGLDDLITILDGVLRDASEGLADARREISRHTLSNHTWYHRLAAILEAADVHAGINPDYGHYFS